VRNWKLTRSYLQGASIEEVASKLATLPLVHEGFLQPPMIVPLKPYSGFAPRSYPEKRNKGQI
jgi:hypothetical protein